MIKLDMNKTNFTWNEAYKYMLCGHKVTNVEWKEDDYLYMENFIIYCDGGFDYREYLTKEMMNGQWNLYKEKK